MWTALRSERRRVPVPARGERNTPPASSVAFAQTRASPYRTTFESGSPGIRAVSRPVAASITPMWDVAIASAGLPTTLTRSPWPPSGCHATVHPSGAVQALRPLASNATRVSFPRSDQPVTKRSSVATTPWRRSGRSSRQPSCPVRASTATRDFSVATTRQFPSRAGALAMAVARRRVHHSV
jgi:hypothetical protein